MAASSHWANPILGGTDPRTGRPFVFYDIIIGGFGGRPMSDGMEGAPNAFNIDGIPVEVNENSYPILVERIELIPDSAGAGRHRGGHGVRKDVRLLGDDLRFANLTDRQKFPPPGVLGGLAGEPGRTILNGDRGEQTVLDSKGTYSVARGDLVTTYLSGAGGYGDPLERDLDAVARDLRDGLLSPTKAREAYGVVCDRSGAIDREATEAERRARRDASVAV
jgi:N-methylhydantoinase B